MLYVELEVVIQNVAFLHNELRDEDVVVADEAPTTDVIEILERADIEAPAIDLSFASVTSDIENKRRMLDPADKDEKVMEAEKEVGSK